MLDFSNVTSGGGSDFELIPAGTVARVIITLKRGGEVLSEFSQEPLFKSNDRGTKWVEFEFTVIGGTYDKRKFWQNIMLDGGKRNPESGNFYTKEIGMQTIKDIIDSAKGLSKSDISPEAMQTRNISGLEVMDGMEFCAKIGVEKGSNGYADKNKLVGTLCVGDNQYVGNAQVQTPQPTTTPPTSPSQNVGNQQGGGVNPMAPWAKTNK
tara:strand:- start:33 stop:659 length:627 start_codon:yes stop_codon:yes gene_type:complete